MRLKNILSFNIFASLRRFAQRRKLVFLFTTVFVFTLLIASTSFYIMYASFAEGRVLGTRTFHASAVEKSTNIISPISEVAPSHTPTPTITPTATPKPTRTPKPNPTNTPTPTIVLKTYTAEKIGDTTYKVHDVANDALMASPQEIFNALNSYRQARGVGALSWDSKLADLAQSRANTFGNNGSLDNHAGFKDFMNNEGFDKSGFNGLGENSAFLSGPMNGNRIINEIFGADGDHDGNQLNSAWTHAAVGVSGNGININFGKNKQ